MIKPIIFNKIFYYMACMCILCTILTSCETDDSDVAHLITGNPENPIPEKPFAMEGTWVMQGLNTQATITVLGNTIELGETVDNLLLGLLKDMLPINIESLADLRMAIKIEPGAEADIAKLSSPTIDLLVNSPNLYFELLKTTPFTIESKDGLVEMLANLVLLNYVTEETPDGILLSETPLAGLGEMLGEKATLQSMGFACEKSLLSIVVSEENQMGNVTLTLDGKLKIMTKNSGLAGIFLRNATTHLEVNFQLDEWTALD